MPLIVAFPKPSYNPVLPSLSITISSVRKITGMTRKGTKRPSLSPFLPSERVRYSHTCFPLAWPDLILRQKQGESWLWEQLLRQYGAGLSRKHAWEEGR